VRALSMIMGDEFREGPVQRTLANKDHLEVMMADARDLITIPAPVHRLWSGTELRVN
jgi:hypothetical protein